MSDKTPPQKLATIGMTIATLTLLILIFLDVNTAILIVIAMILQEIVIGLQIPFKKIVNFLVKDRSWKQRNISDEYIKYSFCGF